MRSLLADDGSPVQAPPRVVEPDAEGTQSEREEALWCQVVLLREKISRLYADLALRDEMIELLREVKPSPRPTPPDRPRYVPASGWHPCARAGCTVLIPPARIFCCRRHAAQQRWEAAKGARDATRKEIP